MKSIEDTSSVLTHCSKQYGMPKTLVESQSSYLIKHQCFQYGVGLRASFCLSI